MSSTITAADLLTIVRVLLVPFFAWAFLKEEGRAALIFFSAAGFTDLIDGSVARWCGRTTRFGAVLDPIADKLLLETCFICLTIVGVVPLWFLILALGRDIMILSGIAYLAWIKARFDYRASLWSKWATLFQIMTAVLGLLVYYHQLLPQGFSLEMISQWFDRIMGMAIILIIVSGLRYFALGIQILRSQRS